MKATIPTIAAFSTAFSSTFGSSIAVGVQDAITAKFEVIPSKGTLIVSLYLVGCAMGPFIYAPMGEIFGRKYALGTGVTLMFIFAAASAAAPNWNSLLAFRVLAGLGASAPMIVSGGILADIFKDPAIRGYIITGLMVAITLGSLNPLIISLQVMARWPDSWLLCFWIHTAISGLSWLIVLIMPETNTVSKTPSGAQHNHPASAMLQRLLLPTRMALFEPIVVATCLFLSLQYSIFYLFFQLIPPLFE
ncbi:hypothetical protein ACJQWK_05073 [Exserohilum turcicum]